MELVLSNLRLALRPDNQRSSPVEKLYPQAKELEGGQTTRDLALPPMDQIFACLRIAKESPQVSMLWLSDFLTPSQFNDYFVRVVSPGPASEAELIIVHCSLCWLFHECAKVTPSEATRADYLAQSLLSEANLETVLSNLRFHQAMNLDLAYAMAFAVRYSKLKLHEPGTIPIDISEVHDC
jgi:hypothetical protein